MSDAERLDVLKERSEIAKTSRNQLCEVDRRLDEFVKDQTNSNLVQFAVCPGLLREVANKLEAMISEIVVDDRDALDAVQETLTAGTNADRGGESFVT